MWILVLSLKSVLLGQPHGAPRRVPEVTLCEEYTLGLHRAELVRQEVRKLPSGIKIPVNFQNKTPSTDLGSC